MNQTTNNGLALAERRADLRTAARRFLYLSRLSALALPSLVVGIAIASSDLHRTSLLIPAGVLAVLLSVVPRFLAQIYYRLMVKRLGNALQDSAVQRSPEYSDFVRRANRFRIAGPA